MNKNISILFTMFSSLGDLIVMSDAARKARAMGAHVLVAHSGNPMIASLPEDERDIYFNVFNPGELWRLCVQCRRARGSGQLFFGIQQGSGSLRGFFFLSFLKKTGAIDHIVDRGLYDADVIIAPQGVYILDVHLEQAGQLLGITVPDEMHILSLPETLKRAVQSVEPSLVGIHPWSRRWQEPAFVWPFEKWALFLEQAAQASTSSFLVFGRNPRFEEFKAFLNSRLDKKVYERILFQPVSSIEEMVGAVSRCGKIVSVNTGVVHIAHALKKKTVILNGPSFNLWIPKGDYIRSVKDRQALFSGSDKQGGDEHFPMVSRVTVEDVFKAFLELN